MKETLVTTIPALAKKLKISVAKASKVVEMENKRLYGRDTPKSVNNPSKMIHHSNRSKFTYRVEDFKKHLSKVK